ncbi:hypothetical protein Tco_0167891 [Tanacetum coccineum]
MTTLKFADTHNMVAFLSKPAESEGFEQIVYFLNANPIRYALTINPTIYISCIEQFWSTVKAKTVNGEVQLQALVDGKKIIITELTVRIDLRLEDAEGVDCILNATIFEQLALIRYGQISQKLTFYKAFFSQQWKFLIHTVLQCLSAKTTAWNEFSSTMASAIICLATNQKFNFSKYIFESMVKNLDNLSGKFLMYPRFMQVFLDQQLEGMSSHNRIYVTPSHTKNIFRKMRRVGKGFSGREIPLFQTMVVQEPAEMGEGSANPTDPHHTPTIIQPSPQPQKKQKPRKPKRKDTQIPQSSGPTEHVTDEAVYTKLDDSLLRAATTASSLEAKQHSGGGPRRQETMRDTTARTRFESVSKLSNDLLLARVLDLEKTKTTQANEIDSLKRRVKRLEKKKRSRTHRLKRLYKGRINAIDVDEDITLINDQDDADMFDVSTLTSDEVLEEPEVVVKDVNLSVDEVTLAQALATLKSTKVQEKGDVVEEPSVPISTVSTKVSVATTTTATIPTPRKGIVFQELGLMKKLLQSYKLKFDEEAKIEADHELAQRLQAQEQEELSDAEKATLFVQLLEKKRKHFAAKKAEEKRNKPPTQAQQRKIICTYLKNMEVKKPKDLKNKSFDSIQKIFDKAFKKVNTFVDFRTDLVEGSSKRAGEELEQESSKTQKVDDDKEIAELKSLMEFIPDEEEVALYAIPLAV